MYQKRNLALLRATAKVRPEGYLDDVMSYVIDINEEENWYMLTDDDFSMLRAKYTQMQIQTQSIKQNELKEKNCNCSRAKKKQN